MGSGGDWRQGQDRIQYRCGRPRCRSGFARRPPTFMNTTAFLGLALVLQFQSSSIVVASTGGPVINPLPGRSFDPRRPTPPQVRGNLQTAVGQHWDFEDGTLQGFQHEDAPGARWPGAFYSQPTFGSNVSAARALSTADLRLPNNPCQGLNFEEVQHCEAGPGAIYGYLSRLRRDLNRMRTDHRSIGGNYWVTPFPIGQQGLYWIGSFERRPSQRIPRQSVPNHISLAHQVWGTTQGDRLTGRLVSPAFEIQHRYFHLLVGGGCSSRVGVYLQGLQNEVSGSVTQVPRNIGLPGTTRPRPSATTLRQRWRTLEDRNGNPIVARGYCIENMVRVSFDISHLRATKARILIEDRASGNWGHINVDDIWITDRPPPRNSRAADPVWGIADLHAHLMSEHAFAAFDGEGTLPEARAFWGSATGPIRNLRGCNDTHTTNDASFNSHQDEVLGTTYTLCRDWCLNLIEGAGLPDVEGDNITQARPLGGYHNTQNSGYPRFVNWPMWYSAIHQQMHNSWVRRALRGGVRLIIASVGNSEVVSFAMAKEKDRPFTSDQDAIALQIPAIKNFAEQNSDWAEIAYTPRDARRIINSGKLAIVIGVELDHVMDTCSADVTTPRHHQANEFAHPNVWAPHVGVNWGLGGVGIAAGQLINATTRVMHVPDHPTTCTDTQIEARIDALFRAGVRHIIPVHFSDNLLGGYAINGDLFVASAIFGSPKARPPTLMSQPRIDDVFGDRRPFTYKLPSINIPIWAKLRPDAVLQGDFLPPGVARPIADFFLSRCIEDEGIRIAAAAATGGATELACALDAVTAEVFEAARRSMPYEGASDSAAMVPLDTSNAQGALPFHINARGLTHFGRFFIREMMRRGMLIDIQHSSEMMKRDILGMTRSYPVMASHGGVQVGDQRPNENVVSVTQERLIYDPPNSFSGGLIGLGAQGAKGLVDQIDIVAQGRYTFPGERHIPVQIRGIALGTDLNGLDWHAPPRFGQFAFYGELPSDRARRWRNRREQIGPMVSYARYPRASQPWASTLPTCSPTCPTWSMPASADPAITPTRIVAGRRVTRTFDINFDGLAHYGLLPDFLQEVSILGRLAERAMGTNSPRQRFQEKMGAVFRSAEALIRMWETTCFEAYQQRSPPRSLQVGCGPATQYQ